jgi:hypothetical protein
MAKLSLSAILQDILSRFGSPAAQNKLTGSDRSFRDTGIGLGPAPLEKDEREDLETSAWYQNSQAHVGEGQHTSKD